MRLALIAALLAVGSPAVASAQTAAAQRWTVDKAASSVTFTSSFDGAKFTGGFRTWNADISFDPGRLQESRVTATFSTATVTTPGASYADTLPTQDWFFSEKFPTAQFSARVFKALGGDRYLATGTLTMRGVTKPLTLPFTVVITGDTAKMTSSVGINRLAFGVGQNEWQTTEAVPGTVTVNINLTARKAK